MRLSSLVVLAVAPLCFAPAACSQNPAAPIDAQAPPDLSSTVDAGGDAMPDLFHYAMAPRIDAVSPSFVGSNGGAKITLTGDGFYSGATVTFSGNGGTTFGPNGMSVVSATTITAFVPPHAPDVLTVTVTNTDGQQGTKADALHVFAFSLAFGQVVDSPTNLSMPFDATLADFDGDGVTDLAIVDRSLAEIQVMQGKKPSGFVPLGAPLDDGGALPFAVAAGHFFSATTVDLATADAQKSQIALRRNTGAFAKEPDQLASTGALQPTAMIAARIQKQGNGYDDLVISDQHSASVGVLINHAGTFDPPIVITNIGMFPYRLIAGDFNADGVTDIVVGDYVAQSLTLLRGSDGLGHFDAPIVVPAGGGVGNFAVAHLVPGQPPQLVVTGNDQTGIRLFQGTTGSDGFQLLASNMMLTDVAGGVAVDDFNGDGLDDIVVSSQTYLAVFQGLGNTMFALQPSPSRGKGGPCFLVASRALGGPLPEVVTVCGDTAFIEEYPNTSM